MNLIEAIRDPQLFGPWFKGDSWNAWIVFLKALFGLTMDQEERNLFESLCGHHLTTSHPYNEAWLVVGRRGGKSRIVAVIAVFIACFHDFSKFLSPGERGVVMIIAADRKQARVIFRYALAMLEGVPMLNRMIVRSDKESIELNNGINIEIHTASYRSTRGFTCVCALCDEIAFWRSDESANPDKEIITALRPAMATIPNALLIGLSSPYAKRGALYEAYRAHYGKESDVLVVQADTRTMNPTIPEKFIAQQYEKDPQSAAAEYGAQFRGDIETFVSIEALDAVTAPNNLLPYDQNYSYRAFTDPSGGSKDAWTLAIAHNLDGLAVLDLVIEKRPPFSPESVVQELAQVLKQYNIYTVHGDRYAGQFPRELFEKQGIGYQVSELNRSELYLELLPLIMSGKVQLLEHKRLLTQLSGLERRTARSGKDSIDHRPGSHDDLANSAAGALVLAKQPANDGAVYVVFSALAKSEDYLLPDGEFYQ